MTWTPPNVRDATTILRSPIFRPAVILCLGATVILCGCHSAGMNGQSFALAAAKSGSAVLGRIQVSTAEPDFDNLPEPPPFETARPLPTPISAPRPFAWQNAGRSSGGRPFQVQATGRDGYRTLVVGSVGGNDPLAIAFVEKLARHLHDNQLILGGFETSLIRTLNPDGDVNKSVQNQSGVYINHKFPTTTSPGAGDSGQPAEVRFLLDRLREFQPQRVIHIRTVRGSTGLIAASSPARGVADELAKWLGYSRSDLPGKSVEGSLERYLSQNGTAQIVTVGLPDAMPSGDLWNSGGDAVLNLLLGDDPATREIARKQRDQSSALNRRSGSGRP